MGRVAGPGKVLKDRRSLPPVTLHLALEGITLHPSIPPIDHIDEDRPTHDQVEGGIDAIDHRSEMTGTLLAEWYQQLAFPVESLDNALPRVGNENLVLAG